MEWVSGLVNLLEAIAWPVVAAVIFFNLKGPISDAVSKRLTKIGAKGLEFDPLPQVGKETTDESSLIELVEMPPDDDPKTAPYIAEIEKWIKKQVDAADTALKASRENILIRAFANHYAAYQLLRAYRTIYGSQINAIDYMQQHEGKANIDTLRVFYDAAVTATPIMYRDYSFEMWLAYLTSWNLVEMSGKSANLTPQGNAFITYIEVQGFPRNPPG